MAPVTFAAIGPDHRHIYGMTQGMIDVGAKLAAWWTRGEPQPAQGFIRRVPDAPRCDLQTILDDPTGDQQQRINVVLCECMTDNLFPGKLARKILHADFGNDTNTLAYMKKILMIAGRAALKSVPAP